MGFVEVGGLVLLCWWAFKFCAGMLVCGIFCGCLYKALTVLCGLDAGKTSLACKLLWLVMVFGHWFLWWFGLS